MEYYLSDYIWDGEGRKVPRVADGSFTSINILDKAIVALPERSDGPGRTHLGSNAKEASTTPHRLLGRVFNVSLGGDCLANALAELLLKHIPPGLRPYSPPIARTAVHGPGEPRSHGERYQIWLGNECIWSVPCLRGGADRIDNFNRVDEVPLETGVTSFDRWDVITSRDLPNLIRLTPFDDTTGAVVAPASAGTRHRGAKWNNINTAFKENHAAQIDAINLASTVGPTMRHQAGADTFYHVYYFQNNPAAAQQGLFISKFIGGIETSLASIASITTDVFNTSDATIRGVISGSTIVAWFKGTGYSELTAVLTITDTAITGGQPGFDISSRPTGAVGGPLDQGADNFQCDGDVEGAQFGQPINC